LNLHHIGFFANSLEEAQSFLFLEDDCFVEAIDDKEQNNYIYIARRPKDGVWLEIIVPTNSLSTVQTITKKRKYGFHHLGYQVESLEDAVTDILRRPRVIMLSGFKLYSKSFGGEIQTRFFSVNDNIIEFLEVVQ
jgi:hypothetical protein